VRTFVQLVVAGIGVGLLYALVAAGFVVIHKATGVLNFAQGSLVLAGAYLTYWLHRQVGVAFGLAILLAVLGAATLAAAVERLVLRPMVGRPPVAIIMITFGLAIVIDEAVIWIWGPDRLSLGDPWGVGTVPLPLGGGVRVATTDVVRLVAAGVVLAALTYLYRRSRLGLAMRAAASDQEAARAQGVHAGRAVAAAWAGAAAIAAVAGVLLAAGARGLDPTLTAAGLLAFPACVLGGLDSERGAVVGGVVIGLVEVLAAGYNAHLPAWMGGNVHLVAPYVVLVAVLLVRPQGLFGTAPPRRV
jgi:branched-chain amino acid transport system permease protein